MTLIEQQFIEQEIAMGITPDNKEFVELAASTIKQAKTMVPFGTLLDYGAGVGVYAEEARKAGYQVYVYEKFVAHRDFIGKRFPELEIIDEPITTDIMLFIEVAEHMTDKELDTLFDTIRPGYILFSSTPHSAPNDKEWGHINIKQQGKWIEFFKQKGYDLHKYLFVPTHWALMFKINST